TGRPGPEHCEGGDLSPGGRPKTWADGGRDRGVAGGGARPGGGGRAPPARGGRGGGGGGEQGGPKKKTRRPTPAAHHRASARGTPVGRGGGGRSGGPPVRGLGTPGLSSSGGEPRDGPPVSDRAGANAAAPGPRADDPARDADPAVPDLRLSAVVGVAPIPGGA